MEAVHVRPTLRQKWRCRREGFLLTVFWTRSIESILTHSCSYLGVRTRVRGKRPAGEHFRVAPAGSCQAEAISAKIGKYPVNCAALGPGVKVAPAIFFLFHSVFGCLPPKSAVLEKPQAALKINIIFLLPSRGEGAARTHRKHTADTAQTPPLLSHHSLN